jgi:hypothetical protein
MVYSTCMSDGTRGHWQPWRLADLLRVCNNVRRCLPVRSNTLSNAFGQLAMICTMYFMLQCLASRLQSTQRLNHLQMQHTWPII